MNKTDTTQQWEAYRASELARLKPMLAQMGYMLEERQPHIAGERHLTGTGGRKLVLLGRSSAGRVVIKATSDADGIAELRHERQCRSVLERIGFAYQTFNLPRELYWGEQGGMALLVTEFIEQDKPFLERPTEEQFALALTALKAQESAHATTASHVRSIRRAFGEMRSEDYIDKARAYAREIIGPLPERAVALIKRSRIELERYCGFLTHWDFMPQNIRIRDDRIYLLDHASLRFGNKYEGWARFINFMELYNPPLARALVQYVRDNRAPGESEALRAMRAYRLLELIRYYVGWLPRTTGNLEALAHARIAFWSDVLGHVLDATDVSPQTVAAYIATRDSLRSEDEKERQRGLH